nr:putative nucleotidyltransferase substrate binding domain-containing protein [Acidovorax temperans]
FPLVHGVRSLALAHQVRATSTAARVQALVGLGALSPGEGEDLAEALHVFMALKLKAGLAEQEQARPVSGTVVVQQLSSLDRDLLKDALGVVKRFQQLLRTRFHLGAL